MLEHQPVSQASERILGLRAELGLTQEQLAQQLGVSVASVIRWEHGRSHPSDLAWQRILRAERKVAFASPPGPLSSFAGEGEKQSDGENSSDGKSDAGRARPEQVATAVAADPPSLSPRTNLPAPLSSFIGREHELSDILRLLGTSRLLTLTGAGGSGKTRLALEAAREVTGDRGQVTGTTGQGTGTRGQGTTDDEGGHAGPPLQETRGRADLRVRPAPYPTEDSVLSPESFEDGVWLVELAPISDPALVPHAIAAVLRVPEQPGQPLSETLRRIPQDEAVAARPGQLRAPD